MSVKLVTDGLVIWETKTGEADRVITILTEGGVVTAYAAGSVRPKNKLTSSTALFAFSNFELFQGKNMYTVDEAECLKKYVRLYADVQATACASYMCELMKSLAPIEEPSKEYLSLALNTLFLLDAGKKDIRLIKSAFELRIMTLAGYMPDLVACVGCGRDISDKLRFDSSAGNWQCGECASSQGLPLNCRASVLRAMRYIIYADASKMFSFELSEDSLALLSDHCSKYVTSQLERVPATLSFFKTITSP